MAAWIPVTARADAAQANQIVRDGRVPEQALSVGDPDRAATAACTTVPAVELSSSALAAPAGAVAHERAVGNAQGPSDAGDRAPRKTVSAAPAGAAGTAPSTAASRVCDKRRATDCDDSKPIGDPAADLAASAAAAIARRSHPACVDTSAAPGAPGAGAVSREG